MRKAYFAVPLLLVMIMLLTSCSLYDSSGLNGGVTQAASSKSGGEVQQPEQKVMVPDFSLKDLDGKTIKLSDFSGKIVFLNFWATWCPYCVQEMPELNEFSKELSSDNKAVFIAVDVGENADTVKKFLTDKKYSLTPLLDTEGQVSDNYGITGLPTTLVVNKDGTLYTAMPGATDKKTLEDILNKLTQTP